MGGIVAVTLRNILFWSHLVAGVVAGVVILLMSVTGVLLAFERQITTWADGHHTCSPATADATRILMETVVLAARDARDWGDPRTVTMQSGASDPVMVGFGRERVVFVDPYTGNVLGDGSQKARTFFHVVTDLHRWLGAHGERRPAARAVTGACNLAFLFLVVSGFYLWWPRSWTPGSLRSVIWFKSGLTGKARDWNWHNVIGFWSAVPLFFIVLTGVVMSYAWANNLLFRLSGSEPPPPRTAPARPNAVGDRQPLKLDGIDTACVRAREQVPGWETITLRLPTSPKAPATFTIDSGNGARPDKRGQLTVNLTNGEIVRWEPYADESLGRKLRLWVRWVHTGEAAGLTGQIIALLASAGGALLVWTGLAMAWRRFFPRRSEMKQLSPVESEIVTTVST